MDPIVSFKENAKLGWSTFAPTEMFTGTGAPRLVEFAGINSGSSVLDVGCGTGVAALTAARLGAKVTGVDLTPQLITRARENAAIMNLPVDWHEGDAEALPFADSSFDCVISQFGHMFAPRPAVAIAEMLRVLRPGGTIAFSTWPPELMTGRMFALIGRYGPPLPPGASPPPEWGNPTIVRERLGSEVKSILFDRSILHFPILSVPHYRLFLETNVGPIAKLVQVLAAKDPEKVGAFRRELEELVTLYFENNRVRQDYLLTRAIKA